MVTSQKSYPRAYVLRKSPTKSDRLEERTSHTFGGSIGRMPSIATLRHCCMFSVFVRVGSYSPDVGARFKLSLFTWKHDSYLSVDLLMPVS
jgi:hypothetical protein